MKTSFFFRPPHRIHYLNSAVWSVRSLPVRPHDYYRTAVVSGAERRVNLPDEWLVANLVPQSAGSAGGG